MALRLPPPFIFICCLCLMKGVALVAPPAASYQYLCTIYPWLNWLPWGLMALAVWIASASVWAFYSHKTTLDPRLKAPVTRLVTTGSYRFSRNPMYLSLLIILVAASCYWQNYITLSGPLTFIYLINRYQIKPEEAYLRQHLGQAYIDYQAKVRRWL